MANYAESLAARRAFLSRLADLEEGATQEMLRAYSNALDRIERDMLAALEADTPHGRAIAEAFDGAPDTHRISVIRGRAEAISNEFARMVPGGAQAVKALAPTAYRLGIDQAGDQIRSLNARFTRPNRRQVEQTVARLQRGTAAREYLDGFAITSTQQAVDTMTAGVILGERPDKITRRLRTHVETTGRARLQTFVHTEVLGAARAGIADSYRENSDILNGWVWNAEESAQTCEVCWAMNGTEHTLDEDLDSHPNCRCVQTPITKTWEELAGEDGMGAADVPETGARPFDPDERFNSVLSEDEKIKVLGAGKYRLWRDGEIRLADLVTPTMSERWGAGLRATTLRELRERGAGSGVGIIEQVAAGAARTTPEIAVTVNDVDLDDIATLFDVKGGTRATRQRIGDALDAINGVHGVRSDTTWTTAVKSGTGRNARFEVGDERGSIPIYVRGESRSGEGGYFESVPARRNEVQMHLPVEIVTRPHSAGGMLDYETIIGHEFGHYIDTVLMPRITGGAQNSQLAWRIATNDVDDFVLDIIENRELADAFAAVFSRAIDTDTFDMLQSVASSQVRAYMTSPNEMFARIYAQWIAERSGNSAMRDSVSVELSRQRVTGQVRGLFAWRSDEFAPIADAMDELFRVAGMMR